MSLSCVHRVMVGCVGGAVVCTATAPAHGQHDDDGASTAFVLGSGLGQDSGVDSGVDSDAAQDGGASAGAGAGVFGRQGQEWWFLGTGVAQNFDAATDVNLHVGYSRFLADDVEWLVEASFWYHAQRRDDALSFNPAMTFRWHFYATEDHDLTVFADAGIGVLLATDNTPQGGTGFNFTPRVGVGVTKGIGDSGGRLVAGLRWHHISNARISGEDRNPDRDAPMVYVGLSFPLR